MDFFQAQEHAVARSRNLLFLFLAAVVGMIAVVYVVLVLATGTADLGLLVVVAAGMSFVIGAGALTRTAQLRKGGAVVAELVGGMRVRPDTSDPHERRLLNIVEEMSIASGVPVPAVFVLGNEAGINAFAAGHTIHDAAVAVTRGALESLSRDELQGVVAHEFSHILNGDMRLNIRLMGLLFGILLLTVIGRGILRGSGGGRRRGKGSGQVALVGLALVLVGYLGVFFGRMIQAAVSRQREFLADAAAVQFTRNPDGIGGALMRIGGGSGSRVADSHAQELGHFFFADGMRGALAGAFATHPPLGERIRRIVPGWDGQFRGAAPLAIHGEGAVGPDADRATSGAGTRGAGSPEPRGRGATWATPSPGTLVAGLVGSVGTVTPVHVAYARELLARLPAEVREAAHRPEGAPFVVAALLLSDDAEAEGLQLEVIRGWRGDRGVEQVRALRDLAAPLGPEARLPLLDLALPTLREISPGEASALLGIVPRMIRADGRVLPFEFALYHVLGRHLPGGRPPHSGRARLDLDRVRGEAKIVLAAVARAGASPDESPEAGQAADLDAVDAALERLTHASLDVRKGILEAAVETALGDGRLRVPEVEIVRAIAEALDIPLPPIWATEGRTART